MDSKTRKIGEALILGKRHDHGEHPQSLQFTARKLGFSNDEITELNRWYTDKTDSTDFSTAQKQDATETNQTINADAKSQQEK